MKKRYLIIVLGIAIAAIASPRITHAAYTVDDLRLQLDPTNKIGAALCTADSVKNIITQLQSGYLTGLIANIKDDVTQLLQTMAFRLAECAALNFVGFGNGFAGAIGCQTIIGGSDFSALKHQALNQIRSSFLTNCTGRAELDQTFDIGRQILAENGRDGGPAFVQDWRDLQSQSQYRGLQIARNEMANTDYCPWLQGDLQGLFNFSQDDAVDLSGEHADGTGGYTSQARCSLPDNFNVYDPKNQTLETLAALTQPENNLYGSYLLAQGTISSQISSELLADQNEFANTGGVGALREINPQTGTSCEVMAKDGSTCLKYSKITQPSAGTQAEINAQRQASYDWIVTSRNDGNQVLYDVKSQIVSSLLDLTQPSIKLQYGADLAGQDLIDNPVSSVTPNPSQLPSSPNDLECTGGNPDCRCVRNDSSAQDLARGPVLQATLAAIQQHPELVTPDGSSVLPGMGHLFLIAVCDTSIFSAGNCHPNGDSDDEIVVSAGGIDISIDIIASSGAIRRPGQAIAACLPGVQ